MTPNLALKEQAAPTTDIAGEHAAGSGGLELNDLARIFFERRYIILATTLLGLLAGIALSLIMTPLYRSTALLELNPPSSQVIESASGQEQAARFNAQEMVATQLGLLRSESLARRTAQELNLVANPEFASVEGTRQQKLDQAVSTLQRNTLVEAVRDSTLMKVTYVSPSPELAARIANALAEGFIASALERRYDSSSYARNFLSNQLATTRKALEDSERALNAYALNTGIVRTPERIVNGVATEGTSLAAMNLEALNAALNEARVRRINAEQAFRNNSAAAASAANTASTATLRDQRAAAQAEYDQKSRIFKEDYPELVEVRARIAGFDRAISRARTDGESGQRNDLQAEFRAAQDAERQLEAQLEQLKGRVQSERGTSIQYNILKREVDQNRSIYDALLQRYKEIVVAGGIGQTNVSIVDRAETPQQPFRPNIPLNAAIGLLGGLALGVALAVVAHLMLDNIVTPADVRNKLKLPVLGVIPEADSDLPLFEVLADPKSDMSEAYYALRSSLKFLDDGGMPRVLLFTSTSPGEGKSTSAYALASSVARSGQSVLLIDADLRKPTFQSSQQSHRGLATLLISDEPAESAIEDTQVPGLHLLPVGRFVGSAAELLSSPRLVSIIKEVRERYDVVFIDGPPVLGFADAPLIGSVAEKTVLVVQARAARTASANEMIRRLRASGSDLAGVVLTKVRGGMGYGYNYYSYSYGDDVGGKVMSDPKRAIDIGTRSTPVA